MAEMKKGKDQEHHIVPKSYLNQWKGNDNQIQLFTHDDGRYLRRGSDWTGFKRKNFNVYEDQEEYFLPERITEEVDAQSIDVIKNLTFGEELSGYQRSVIAHCVALQYMRTPRFRGESDLLLEEQIKEPFLDSQRKLSDKELIRMKQEALATKPETKKDELAIEEIKGMSDEEFIKTYKDFISGDNVKIGLNTFGHSKFIFKVPEKAKGLFSFMWFIFAAHKDSSFITSDNPCFAVPTEESDLGVGLFSKNGLVVFPLRPDLCLAISPAAKSGDERYKRLSKSVTRELNQMILEHSYEVVAAKDLSHLKSLLKGYSHRKTKEVHVKEFGEYKLSALK